MRGYKSQDAQDTRRVNANINGACSDAYVEPILP